jgi:hypothetical protein
MEVTEIPVQEAQRLARGLRVLLRRAPISQMLAGA